MRDIEKEELYINLLYLIKRKEELRLPVSEKEEKDYLEAVKYLKDNNIEIPFGIEY